jgi:phosphoglycerate dehydrogenase-like enzyme
MRRGAARTTPFIRNSILGEKSGFTTRDFARAISSSFCSSSSVSDETFAPSSRASGFSASEKGDLETIRRRNFPIRTVHVFEKQQQQRRKKTRMSSKAEEKEEEKNIIPVTVFVNQKLMDSKPIERLRGMKFDRLKIECVSDENDGGDDDDDFADNALGEKEESVLPSKMASSESSSSMMMKTKKISAVGWWFANTDALSKHMEREQMTMMMKTTKSGGKEEKEEKCKSGDEIVWTHSASAGVDHLLKHEAIQTHGSVMTNAKGAFSASLGEWAIFASMYFAKEVFNMQRAQREKVWKRFQVDMLKGKEMLVVGYGDIGRSIGKRAKAMGMVVNGVRSKKVIEERDREVVSEMFTLQELEKAVETADYVALALPHTRETENVVGVKVFGKMKSSAVLINVGRGASVDENALCDALNTGKIRGAALDVFQTEPLPESSPLWSIDEAKLLMSFHSADLTSDYHDLAMDVFVENLRRFDQSGGKTDDLINKVDKTVGY